MSRRVFILGVCLLQFFWALMLVSGGDAIHVTSLAAIGYLLGNTYLLSAVILTAVVMALVGELNLHSELLNGQWWFFPQLFIVVISAIGSLVCIWRGMYADGVPRSVAFIASDQMIYPLLAIGYYRAISRP